VFALGAVEGAGEPARLTLDILSWPVDGGTTYGSPDTRFLSALTGGFLFGWGVMVWRLASLAYDQAPEAVRRSLVSGVLAWFVVDSAGSAASGNASNVVFNILVALLVIGPMWRPAVEDRDAAAASGRF
jgi:biotin transporter BioY